MAEKKKTTGTRKISGPVKMKLKDKADRRYVMLKDIKESPLYGKTNRDEPARAFINENAESTNGNRITPGQLILFNYFEPKTEEQLEYYDASPCTIFFGYFNSKNGKRVLGFNIHYYPPKMRYLIIDKIFELYRPIYTKYFSEGPKKEIDAFDYSMLIEQIHRANLSFGVREYIPSLMTKAKTIPPNMWKVAVFTEGWFKKQTRTAIMKFWNKWLKGTKKGGEVHKNYKTKSKKTV